MHVDEQRFPAGAELLEQLHRRLRAGLGGRERVDDHERPILNFLGERRDNCAALHFARQRVVVAARRGPEDRAAMAPDRIPDGADPRAACALLLPGLASAAADERAVFRHMGAAPLGRVRVDHRLPDHRAVHAPAEDLIAELERPDLFVV